jgi:hypothetical protein
MSPNTYALRKETSLVRFNKPAIFAIGQARSLERLQTAKRKTLMFLAHVFMLGRILPLPNILSHRQTRDHEEFFQTTHSCTKCSNYSRKPKKG